MSIASELSTLQTNLRNSYDAVSSKGGTLPENKNYDNLAASIESISSGGKTITATNTSSQNIQKGDKVWIESSGSNYNLIDFRSELYNNFAVAGSLSINTSTGVVSGFSSSNYLQLPTSFNPVNNPWEVQVKFTTSSDVTTNQQILHSRMGTGNSGRFGIGLSFENTHFNFYCSSDGYSWSFDLYGTYTILTNTTYWVKIGWDGSEYYLEYSLDGETYTRDITNASTSGVYSPLTSSFIGVVNTGSFTNAFRGSIDLSDTSISFNGVEWWNPRAIQITTDTITGYAQENIASGSTGNVMVLLSSDSSSSSKPELSEPTTPYIKSGNTE